MEHVPLALEAPVGLLDRGAADRLCEVPLAGVGRAEREQVLALPDEARCRQFVDERTVVFKCPSVAGFGCLPRLRGGENDPR